jgi:NAD(P)-dependent dehydrogenase (short-subunit alcohol dehydrogenase family)
MDKKYNPFNLADKTILVTGASSGIGKAVAIECSKMDASVIITGRNEQRLANTFSLLDKGLHKKIIAELDSEDQIDLLLNELPEMDGIVHCAGIVNPVPFNFVTRSKLDEIFNINFFGPVSLTQKIAKKKILKKNASIVFIASVSGIYCSSVAGSMYSSTKGAINGVIKGMALDLATKGIRVNSVCPAMIETSILDSGKITREQLSEDVKKYPLQRYGKPEEVAYAVIYLLSDATLWITGTNLLIDGGYTLL